MCLFGLVPVASSAMLGNTPLQIAQTRAEGKAPIKRAAPENATSVSDYFSNFTSRITASTSSDTCQSYTISLRLTQGFDEKDMPSLTLGYYDEEYDYPLMVQYTVLTPEGEAVTRDTEVVYTGNTPYNGLGPWFGESARINLDLLINPGEKVQTDSLVLYNIFILQRINNPDTSVGGYLFIPDTSMPFVIDQFTNTSTNIDLTQYISASFLSYATFGDYTSFKVELHNNILPLYEETMSSSEGYAENVKRLESGNYRYDYSFSGLTTAFLLLGYEDDSLVEYPLITSGVLSTTITVGESNTVLQFLCKDIQLDGLVSLSLCSSTFKVSIVHKETGAEVATSKMSTRFGAIYFEPPEDNIANIGKTDVRLVLILVFVIFTIVYAGALVGIYFYLKQKNRNDEFRRMDTKRFIKTNALGYLASIIVLMDILFISFRVVAINNSLAMFNPLDNYIVVLSILSILFIGYFIKFFYVMIKDNIERKAAEHLKLDMDKDDDGTK